TLLASSPSCFALTFAGATENLLYFEAATLSADYCEKQNFPVRNLLTKWQATHEPLYLRTIQTVRAEGVKRGLATEKEQNELLFEIMGMASKAAQASLARRDPPCRKFGQFIDEVATYFKR
ncbi:hypothetical protein DSI41_18605, partial [Mycobacterium tuberculosis]